MKHSSITHLDTMLRCCWYSNCRYPLSAGLLASSGRAMRSLPIIRMKNKQVLQERKDLFS